MIVYEANVVFRINLLLLRETNSIVLRHKTDLSGRRSVSVLLEARAAEMNPDSHDAA